MNNGGKSMALPTVRVEVEADTSDATKGIRQVQNAFSDLSRASRSARNSASIFEKALNNQARSFDSLRRSLNPTFAATKRYEETVEQANRAVKSGITTQEAANDVLRRAKNEYQEITRNIKLAETASRRSAGSAGRLAEAFHRFGLSARGNATHIRLLPQQFSQIAQQASVTGNVMQAVALQAFDIGAAFGGVGAVIGVLAGLGLPALAAAFGDNADDVSELENQLSNLNDIVSELNDSTDLLSLSIDELSIKYRDAAPRVRLFAEAQAQLRIAELNREFAGSFDELSNAVDRWSTRVDNLQSQETLFDDPQRAIALINIIEDFNIRGDEAVRVLERLNEVARADSFEEQQEAVENLIAALTNLDIPLSQLPVSLQGVIAEITALSIQMDEARVSAEGLRAEMNMLGQETGIPLFQQGLERAELLPPVEEDEDSGRRRRGRRDPIRGRIESLINSLQTEQETIERFRQEGFELLAQANAEELAAIGGQNEAKLRLQEEYMDRLRALQQAEQSHTLNSYATLFGNLATTFQQGGGNLLKVSKAFSVAQGLINSYRAFTEVLADPALIGRPFLRTALAASTLAAGLAQVANIRSVSDNVSAGGGGGSTGASAPATGGQQQPTTFVNVNLTGEGAIGRGQVRGLINMINEEIEDGAVLGGIRIAGA